MKVLSNQKSKSINSAMHYQSQNLKTIKFDSNAGHRSKQKFIGDDKLIKKQKKRMPLAEIRLNTDNKIKQSKNKDKHKHGCLQVKHKKDKENHNSEGILKPLQYVDNDLFLGKVIILQKLSK